MTDTLFDLVYRTARELGILHEAQATGGSTTTIVDTSNRTEASDYWNGGTAFITKDAGGAGAAPEEQYNRISDFDNGTATITVSPGFTVAVDAGDYYAVADKRFPMNILIQMVNGALDDLGRIPVTDTSSITIASSQTEYSLPAACPADGLRKVYIQNRTDDANDNQWTEVFNWMIEVEATGTAPTLILPYQYATGYDLKLVYISRHPQLFGYSDKLSEAIPIERVVYQAAYLALNWWKNHYHQDMYDDAMQRMAERAERVRQSNPIKLPRKPSWIVMLTEMGDTSDLSEPDRVYL